LGAVEALITLVALKEHGVERELAAVRLAGG
jgi:hypothetical protein